MSSGNDNMTAPKTARLKTGFADPVFDSQAAFRAVLDAMSYAGRIHALETDIDGPEPLDPATTALALALFDFDTTVWLDAKTAADATPAFLKFHCGCPITMKFGDAQFGIITDAATMPALDAFAIGEDRYPDRSATLVIQVPTLSEGPAKRWSGPGIKEPFDVRIGGLPEDFWEQWQLNHELYPLGLDVIFASGGSVVGLPRGVKVEG